LKVVKSYSCGALPIHLFRHYCCRMYRSATIQSITGRQTDRQTDRRHYNYDANSRSYNVQYDWLKIRGRVKRGSKKRGDSSLRFPPLLSGASFSTPAFSVAPRIKGLSLQFPFMKLLKYVQAPCYKAPEQLLSLPTPDAGMQLLSIIYTSTCALQCSPVPNY